MKHDLSKELENRLQRRQIPATPESLYRLLDEYPADQSKKLRVVYWLASAAALLLLLLIIEKKPEIRQEKNIPIVVKEEQKIPEKIQTEEIVELFTMISQEFKQDWLEAFEKLTAADWPWKENQQSTEMVKEQIYETYSHFHHFIVHYTVVRANHG